MLPKPKPLLLLSFLLYPVTFVVGKKQDVIIPNICNESQNSFQCGAIPSISYPFWGGASGPSCGRKEFFLECQDNVLMLNISSLPYRVLHINFTSYTIKVARDDLWNTTCPHHLYNTTIDSKLYQFDSISSNHLNVTLFFNCTSSAAGSRPPKTLPNQFSCGAHDVNFFRVGDASSLGPGLNSTCMNNIYVPVKNTSALVSSSSGLHGRQSGIGIAVTELIALIDSGFSIQWIPRASIRDSPCRNRTECFSRQGSNHPGDDHKALAPAIQNPLGAHKNDATGGPNQMPWKKIVIGIVGVTVLSTIIIFWSVQRLHHQTCLSKEHDANLEKVLLQHGSLALKRYRYSEVKKITKSFTEKLGQGGYGKVYEGMLPNGCLVAVKVLAETEGNGEEFVNEVASISRTSHVNIVNLLGFCYDRSKRVLIYEYMPNKSLDKFMSHAGLAGTSCSLDLEKLYKIALGVARGLEYLHTGCNTRIVHFDIKPQNILLDEDFCPKISDFGLAKLCKKKQSVLSMLGARGTIGYIAPEIFSRNFGGVSHKSDVYSYGMMVLEMVGARGDDDDNTAMQSSENYFPDKIYERLTLDLSSAVDAHAVIEEEDERARKMALVGFWCIQTYPSDRPSMSKVLEMLEGSLDAIQIPPKPFLVYPKLSEEELSASVSTYVETEESLKAA